MKYAYITHMKVIYDAKWIEVPEDTWRLAKHEKPELYKMADVACAKYGDFDEFEKIEHCTVHGKLYCRDGERFVIGVDDSVQEAVGLREEAFQNLQSHSEKLYFQLVSAESKLDSGRLKIRNFEKSNLWRRILMAFSGELIV